MSATDQAFIRAYGGPARTGGALPRNQPLIQDSVLAATSTKSLIAQAEHCVHSANTLNVAAEGTPNIPAARVACIEIGLGTVIPSPHANFADQQSSRNFGRQRTSEDEPTAHRRLQIANIGKPKSRAAFGQSAKASLSSFGMPGVRSSLTGGPLKAALEIDSVGWPKVCSDLLRRCEAQFCRLAKEIQLEAEQGQRVVAISGTARGEGRTTLMLCLAKILSSSSRIAIVDADFDSPGIASHLRLSVDRGWEAALRGDIELADVMIESLRDRFTILPLAARQMHTPRTFEIGETLGRLAEHFELVLIDAGPICEHTRTCDWLCVAGNAVDRVILAHDARRGEQDRLAAACSLFEDLPVQIGIAETFVRNEIAIGSPR
jgi:hypothetical protein